MLGRYEKASSEFQTLALNKGSRFSGIATWRLADSLWEEGKLDDAAARYQLLLKKRFGGGGDPGLAAYRIALHRQKNNDTRGAIAKLNEFRKRYPNHVLDKKAKRLLWELGGAKAAKLSASTRLVRAERLTDAKHWHKAIAELSALPNSLPEPLDIDRRFWKGMTLFKMRRQYKLASDILLDVYPVAGARSAEALFYGARGLSRADFDKEAIDWYQRVVKEYPASSYAGEAQYLSGWLEFNLGRYSRAVPYLKEMRRRFPRSKFANEALWYWGMSHYLNNEFSEALNVFDKLSQKGDKEVGGKGRYWKARTLQKLKRPNEAKPIYSDLVGRYPFSWYAQLARSRLIESGVEIGPFGVTPGHANQAMALSSKLPSQFRSDSLFKKSQELVSAGLGTEASKLLRHHQRSFLRQHKKDRADALSALMAAYRNAGNYNKPWMLAVIHGGRRALDVPAKGSARNWWKHAYPLAYNTLIERHRQLGGSPKYYLNTIMRKESGFEPHTHSYADARGLVQMIPPTTKRVVRELGVPYTDGILFEPEFNIKAGSWYIGRLHHKFKQQIPIGAGSYNSGPRPVMRWLTKNGERPMDEFVELVSYKQARNYMRRTTETYARYVYLYEDKVYTQPLVVDKDYVDDQLTY